MVSGKNYDVWFIGKRVNVCVFSWQFGYFSQKYKLQIHNIQCSQLIIWHTVSIKSNERTALHWGSMYFMLTTCNTYSIFIFWCRLLIKWHYGTHYATCSITRPRSEKQDFRTFDYNIITNNLTILHNSDNPRQNEFKKQNVIYGKS